MRYIALVSAAVIMMSSGVSFAAEGKTAGSIMLRARALAVMPDESANVPLVGGDVDIGSDYIPELDLTYFLTDNLAFEVIAGTTRHSVRDNNSLLGNLDLGKVSLLPPTITAQYHFMPSRKFSPYLGVGVNYTVFYDEETTAGSAVTSIDYDNGFGFAVQAGFDYNVSDRWYLNADVKKLFLNTDVSINGGAITTKVDIDPWIVGLGVGYRF